MKNLFTGEGITVWLLGILAFNVREQETRNIIHKILK